MSTDPMAVVTARLQKLIAEWEPRLDLPGIEVRHGFLETYDVDDPTKCAETTIEWQYRAAKIEWYLPMLTSRNDATLEDIVVHEFAHIIIGPLHDRFKANSTDLEELAVESIARALIRTHQKD